MINRSLRQLIRLYAVKVVPTPYMADSITQGTIGSWERKVGDMVKQDDLVANIETDKVLYLSIYLTKGHNTCKQPGSGEDH